MLRQVAVGAAPTSRNISVDQLLIGRPIEHLALVPVADAQHLLCRRRHSDRSRATARPAASVGISDLDGTGRGSAPRGRSLECAVSTRRPSGQPGIDAGARLAHHAGPQHQLMRNDFRFFWRLAQNRQKSVKGAWRVGWSLSRQSPWLPQNYAGTRAGARHDTAANGLISCSERGATWAHAAAPAATPASPRSAGGPCRHLPWEKFIAAVRSRVTQGRALTAVCAITTGANPLAVQRAPSPSLGKDV